MCMCKAFSCLIHKNKTVTWKFGVDSYDDLIKLAGYKDDKSDAHDLQFARVEISPKNDDYINPDAIYLFRLDEKIKPSWWSDSYENKCWDAQVKWLAELDKILIRKPIVNPFDITPPTTITEEHIALLREWASVRDSVGASVWDSVRASVWASVWDSVRASVRDSVRDSVRASVWDSVWASARAYVRASVWDSVWAFVGAYLGSFFNLPRAEWKYTEHIKTPDYPFAMAIRLWELGLVPSFDGTIWRLHGGKMAAILWEGKL